MKVPVMKSDVFSFTKMPVIKTLSDACQILTSGFLYGYLTFRPVILQWKVVCFSSVTPCPVLYIQ